MSLTILLGDYGTGKTATAKYLARQTGGVYLDIDALSKDGVLIDNLRDIIRPGVNYYLDGWTTSHYYAKPQLLGMDVKYIVCMASPKCVIKRQRAKARGVRASLPRTEVDITSTTHLAASFALAYSDNPLFADTTTRPTTFWEKEDWMTRWLEIVLYSWFKDSGEYQDIELSDRTIVGLSKSYKTWGRLNELVDFRGKSVIDYGCNYGYFCFKAEEVGAVRIMGVDESGGVIDVASTIGITKHSRVKFIVSELKDFNPPDTNIIMALNVLHHLDYDRGVLVGMFRHAGMLVFEMPAKDLPIVDGVARSFRFGQPIISNSHREDRCIVIYSKAKPVVLPRKFVYHPRRAAFTKWLFHVARKFLPKKHFGIARRIKRWLLK